jgi:hypothetical protein
MIVGLFASAIARIDIANAEDPRTEPVGGVERPRELVYSERMSAWVERLDPNASEALRLAARAQHIRRWEIPRSDYPMDRAGYYKWRTTLYKFHARKAAEILRDIGYGDDCIGRVESLLQKKDLKTDPEAQMLEDAACLVFLESYFAEFADRDDINEEKMIDILRKAWHKMSERAQRSALKLRMPDAARVLVERALGAGSWNVPLQRNDSKTGP